jgi:aminoglycoside phosphotransferase family enzyme/predicted kinase
MDESQEPVFAFLSDPATHGGAAVKRIDTHAASVFLAGPRALKIKRAVRFPFLDYSTLAKRKAACEAELRINQPLAAQIYRRVLPITRRADGGLELGGDGVPVEWAVEMRRFDENATLDHLAANGEIDAGLADALGRAVTAAQAKAQPVEPGPWIKALADYIEEHAAAFGSMPDIFPAKEADALARASRAAYARVRPLLIERGERGFIRHIHSDLHLGNVVKLDGRPVLFDAIEFSPLIASGDLHYDLAFLLMDLTERGLRPAANIVLNRYLIETKRVEDLDALAALPLFLSVRAAIRAKVTAARVIAAPASPSPATGGGKGGGMQAALKTAARKYFDAARSFIAPAQPMLLAVGGLSGTGKSVLARSLAPDLAPASGAVVLRSDIERKALFGVEEGETLPEHAYAATVTLRVFATLADKARRALAAGHSIIVDAVFSQPHERKLMQQSATALGVPFRGIFLTADLATRIARIGARAHDASDADAAVARRQENYDLGTLEWARVDASGTPEETLARARRVIPPLAGQGNRI